ncbi:hypothetical protein AB0D13_26705 [Streptomyces sp. NPDC048430]|uniref:hypothetical protein n=1 Tax=Streptomyces sp. NPDC048430 TaxID=3155388 RepID=UPI0034276A0D
MAALLDKQAISDGTPIYLDDETMMPVEPFCTWGRKMSYEDLAKTTLKDYGRIMARLDVHQRKRGRDVLSATESDIVAYKRSRTQRTRPVDSAIEAAATDEKVPAQRQSRPVGYSAWTKESGVIDKFYAFAVSQKCLDSAPVRVAARGRNPLSSGIRLGMDIRHLTFDQFRYFRDVGLGGQRPDSSVNRSFRGSSPHRGRCAADLALGTGMRWQEWATVLLPELGIGSGQPGESAEFKVQACAKYGKERTIYAPEDSIESAETYCLLERPYVVEAAARRLGRLHRELFVVSRIEPATGLVRGMLDGIEQEFLMSAMEPELRRMTVREGEFGLEALTLFVCRGGLMPLADSWKRYRHDAWRRMIGLADDTTPLLPAKRWRWHDLRHTYALQLLNYLERQMDGEEPDQRARRRRHRSYLTGHIRYNPLLIVSRRLGHSSPSTTYDYLEYTDDLVNDFEGAFHDWLGDGEEQATYAQIASHAFRVEKPALMKGAEN